MKAATTVLLSLLLAGAYPPASCRAKNSETVVIIPFDNSTGQADYDPLREGLPDLLTSEMARIDGVAVVDREHLNKMLKEQKLSLAGPVNVKETTRVGRLLGANRVLVGGFSLAAPGLRINGHLYDVETTRLMKSVEVTGKATDLVELAHEFWVKLRDSQGMKIGELKAAEIDKSPQVSLHFIGGLGYFYGCMYDLAVMEFMNTLDLDPKHADARFWKAKSYYLQKEWAHAKIELECFLREYPENEEINEVRKMLKTCEGNLEDWQKELLKPEMEKSGGPIEGD